MQFFAADMSCKEHALGPSSQHKLYANWLPVQYADQTAPNNKMIRGWEEGGVGVMSHVCNL